MWRIARISSLALLLALALAGCPGPGGGGWGGAKDFTYASYDGVQAKLSSHAGKPVVVNFWAVN